MLAIGFVAGLLAVILLLWGILRLLRRDSSRWHFLGFLVLAVVSLVTLYLGRPHYRIESVQTAADNPHGYIVKVDTVNSERDHLEPFTNDIIAQVRKAQPDANAIRVEFYVDSSGTWQAQAVWAPHGDWNAAKGAGSTNDSYQTVFDYTLR
jgi:hypothetical protein